MPKLNYVKRQMGLGYMWHGTENSETLETPIVSSAIGDLFLRSSST